METAIQTENIGQPTFPPYLRAFAQVISWLLHPLFIPAYVSYILLFHHPINTLMLPFEMRIRYLAMILINTVLFPGLLVFLLWRLGFLKSLYMKTTRERIIPLVAGLMFYFWAWYVSRNLEGTPLPLQQWLLGVFLCSCAAMFVNIFRMVSLHSIGVGGMVTFIALQQATDSHWSPFFLIPALLIAGLTGTARLIREAHEPSDIYAGYLAGIVCQLAAAVVLGW